MMTRLHRPALGFILALTVSNGGAEAPAPPTEQARAPAPATPAGQQPVPQVIQRLGSKGLIVQEVGIIGHYLLLWRVSPPANDPREARAYVITTRDGLLIQGKVFHAEDSRLLIDTQGNPPILRDKKDRRDNGFPPLRDEPPDRSDSRAPGAAAASRPSHAPAPPEALQATAPARPPTAVPPTQPASFAANPTGVDAAGQTLWDHLGQATVIEEGPAGAPLVYIFIDPLCRYCHQQWTMLRHKVGQGQLRVRWVPVTVLDTSLRRIGVVMGLLHNPSAEALARWMRHQQVAQHHSEATKVALARNLVLFRALQVRSVPALIYKDQHGALVRQAGITPL